MLPEEDLGLFDRGRDERAEPVVLEESSKEACQVGVDLRGRERAVDADRDHERLAQHTRQGEELARAEILLLEEELRVTVKTSVAGDRDVPAKLHAVKAYH